MPDIKYVSLEESREESRGTKGPSAPSRKRAAKKTSAKKAAKKNTTSGGASASKPEEGSA